MEMAEDPNEDLLNEVLGPLTITDGPIDEVEQPRLVAVHECAERLGLARQMTHHDLAVVELMQRLALQRALRIDSWHRTLERVAHRAPAVSGGNGQGAALIHFMSDWHKVCPPGCWHNHL